MIAVGLIAFEALRLGLRAMLFVLILHFARAAWIAFKRPGTRAPPPPDEWPSVTVQLPLRNEYYVVERILRAACALDYPREKLDIQVLDDSTDETRERARALIDELSAEGHRIEHVVRRVVRGYKAGALNHGLEKARGELVAIFDADCAPPADFLRKVVPHFADAEVGCVQVRWSYLNRRHSLLTRVQAIVLDGLFVIDQHARAESRLPLQFNGTNGIWRRSAIEKAGGWNPTILAEDADLSFRAYMAGFRVAHVRDYAVPTEIPEDMAAFRAQQRRWALGSAQMVRALGLRILSARIPLSSKLMMLMHLGRHALDPLVLLACVTSPLTTLYGMPFLIDYGTFLNAGVMGLLIGACLLFYGAALRRIGESVVEIVLVPLVIALAIGLSLVYTAAFLRGLVSRGGEFERTPKAGSEGAVESGPRYRAPRDPLLVLEIGLAVGHAYFAHKALLVGNWPYAGFFAAVALSFGWVGLGTLLSPGVGTAGPKAGAHAP